MIGGAFYARLSAAFFESSLSVTRESFNRKASQGTYASYAERLVREPRRQEVCPIITDQHVFQKVTGATRFETGYPFRLMRHLDVPILPDCDHRESLRRHFVGIHFDQPQSTVGHVLGFIEPIAHLYRPDKKIADDDECEVAL